MQRPSTLTQILSFEDALQAVLAQAEELASAASTQATSLIAAAGRVLAAPVVADRDQPPFDRSTRDGFAVRAEDACRLRLIGSLRAGEQWGGPALASGEAIEIMTGAPMPSGADAVLMVEHGELRGDMLVRSPDRTLRPGENVVPQGREAQAGATLLPVGRRLAAAEIAVAASCGASQLRVYCRPDVAIVATGDELVELDAPLAAWQIRNSNSYALAALVEAAGGQTERLPIAPDTLSGLRERLDSAESADLLLLSGGVSAGKYDLVEQALAERGAEFFFTGQRSSPASRSCSAGCHEGPASWRISELASQLEHRRGFTSLVCPETPSQHRCAFTCSLPRSCVRSQEKSTRIHNSPKPASLIRSPAVPRSRASFQPNLPQAGAASPWLSWAGRDPATWPAMRARTATACCRLTRASLPPETPCACCCDRTVFPVELRP